jgi:hypothetical protein
LQFALWQSPSHVHELPFGFLTVQTDEVPAPLTLAIDLQVPRRQSPSPVQLGKQTALQETPLHCAFTHAKPAPHCVLEVHA